MNEKREKRIKNRHTRADEVTQQQGLEACLKTYEGRRFLWGLLEAAGVFQNPYTGNALDMAFRSGNMNMGQMILNTILETQPASFTTMMQENADRETSLQKRLTEEEENHHDTE